MFDWGGAEIFRAVAPGAGLEISAVVIELTNSFSH